MPNDEWGPTWADEQTARAEERAAEEQAAEERKAADPIGTLADRLTREAVVMTEETRLRLIARGIDVRTSHNLDRVGVLDRWVGWVSPRGDSGPPGYRRSDDGTATVGRPGPLQPAPVDGLPH